MLKFNNKVLNINGNWLNASTSPVPPGPSFDEVTIGSQTWMAKNLDISDGGSGIIVVNNVTANGVNMGTQYYYTYDAAVRIVNSIPGWHLPTKSELETLQDIAKVSQWTPGGIITRQAGMTLKSNEGWNEGNGIDYWGFAAYPVGEIISNSTVIHKGSVATYWSETESSNNEAYNLYFDFNDYAGIGTEYKSCYKSIRLIKD